MLEISLIPYSPDLHSSYLERWLTNEELMYGWGMPPFKIEDIDPWTKDPTRVILMIEDTETKQIVGFVNFYEWKKETKTASRGTLIAPEYQNQGFGKAAIEASNKYAFEKMDIQRIELYIEADNEVSRHITEKLGYIFDRFDPKKQRYYY